MKKKIIIIIIIIIIIFNLLLTLFILKRNGDIINSNINYYERLTNYKEYNYDRYLKYAENNKRIGVVSAAVIFVLLFVMWVIISIYYGKIPLGEIPMLTICKRHGMVVSIIYSIVLFAAMFTTALSNGFALMDSVKGRKGIKIAMLLVVSFYASGLPFDFFVGKLYRYIGYIGFLLCFFILLKFSKKIKLVRKKTKNEENER